MSGTIRYRLAGWPVVIRRVVELRLNRLRNRQSLAARNLRRFRRMVGELAVRSPYYAKIIAERGIDPATCAVTDFPPLTKKLLVDSFDEIVTDKRVTRAGVEAFLARSRNPLDLFGDDFFVVHTSGSTGQITAFVWHWQDWLRGLVNYARIVPPHAFQRLAFVGAVDGHYAGVTMSQTSAWGPLWWSHRVRVFDVQAPLADIVTQLNEHSPAILSAYATVLRQLALEKAAGRLKISPTTILSGGEPLFAEDRHLVESAFGAPVTNVYATSEHMVMGIGPPGTEGMVLQEDDLIIETREDHILVTNLLNRTLPMIRYRMDDVLLPTEGRSQRWPAHRMIRDVVGRQEYAPTFLNEAGQMDTIHPIVFVEFFVPGLEAFQIVIHGTTSFTFLAKVAKGHQSSATVAGVHQRLDSILANKRMRNLTYTVQLTDHFDSDFGTGKFHLIRSEPS